MGVGAQHPGHELPLDLIGGRDGFDGRERLALRARPVVSRARPTRRTRARSSSRCRALRTVVRLTSRRAASWVSAGSGWPSGSVARMSSRSLKACLNTVSLFIPSRPDRLRPALASKGTAPLAIDPPHIRLVLPRGRISGVRTTWAGVVRPPMRSSSRRTASRPICWPDWSMLVRSFWVKAQGAELS